MLGAAVPHIQPTLLPTVLTLLLLLHLSPRCVALRGVLLDEQKMMRVEDGDVLATRWPGHLVQVDVESRQ